MIRFSAFLVAVAVGLLIAGVVTSKLLLVYLAIGLSGVALLALGLGVAVHWRELTSKPTAAEAETGAPGPAPVPPVAAPQVAAPQVAAPQVATAPVGAGHVGAAPAQPGPPSYPRPVPAPPSRAGYLPTTEPSHRPQPSPAAGAPPESRPPESRPPARPPAPRPAAFTAHPQASPPRAWETRDDSISAPATAGRPQPPVPAQPPASAQQPASAGFFTPARPSSQAPPARRPGDDQASAPPRPKDEAKPATAATSSKPKSASEPEPAAPTGPAPTAQAAATRAPADATVTAEDPAEPAQEDPDPAMEVTVVPGVPRYHNARCILIRFMGDSDLDKMTLAMAREAGCTPCRACLPDQPDKSLELPDASRASPARRRLSARGPHAPVS